MFRRLAVLAALAWVMSGLGLAVHAQDSTGIVFQDDFSTDTGVWQIGPRDSGERVIEGGQLRITDFDAYGATSSYLDGGFVFVDIDIEFDTTLLSGHDRGWHVIMLRYQDKDNYHGFGFHAGGSVYGFTVLDGERTVWQASENFAAVRTGFGQVNHVRATATGTTLRFYINGELVTETDQLGPPEGRVGLSVSAPSGDSANGSTEVAFDNIVIRAPLEATSGEDSALSPLATPTNQQVNQQETLVVKAVMFWQQSCPYCEDVINNVLPPLKQQYGEQFNVVLYEVKSDEDREALRQTASQFGQPGAAVPFLIIGDRALIGSGQIAADLPGLIEAHLTSGGIGLPDIPGLESSTVPKESVVIHARCKEIEVPPPAVTTADNVSVGWTWTTRDPNYLEPHRQAVNYIVTLDGVPLSYGDPVYEAVDAGDHTIHALTWSVDVGPLSAGPHRVDYFATWSSAVSTGLTAYGPGTDHPTQVGGCTFEVTDGSGTATGAAQQVDLSSLESVDYAAIAASIPPPVDPERIQQTGDNGAGLPATLTYEFEPEEIAPGVFVDTTASWALSETAIQPTLSWEFRNEGGRTDPLEFTVDIPKEFASSVDEIVFNVPPTEIIEADPVFRWLLVMDNVMRGRIDANSLRLMAISEPDNTLALLEGFQKQLVLINLRRQFQSCQRASGNELDKSICSMTVILQNREHFNLSICDTFGHITDEGDKAVNVVFANACRNLLQPVDDNLHCDFKEKTDRNYRNACLTLTRSVLATSCEGLTGVERNLCLYDVAVHVKDLRGCTIIEDADMAQDCRAQLSGDPAYCAEIADAARHGACCAIFQADAARYAACMGEQEEGSEVIIEGNTLTLDEVLGTEQGDANDGQNGTFGPLPAAPDLGYLMNDAFYAEYACDGQGQTDRPRFIASGGQFFYAGDDEQSFPLAGNLVSTMAEQGHDEFTMTSLFLLGSPGLWMPLDGNVYGLPAVTEVWATDAESYDRYTALELRPSSDTLTVVGSTLDAIRYEGSYTDEVVIDNRDSTFVDGYYSSVDAITFRAWYDQRTGLLLKSHFQRQPVACVREGDYADQECPEPIELVCTLADTSLPIGR